MTDIPTAIQDHLLDTVKDDIVLGQMLRWLRTMVKATNTVQAASLGVAEDFQELQAREALSHKLYLAAKLGPAEAPATVPAEDFCTYCDLHGHHRGNCPELAPSTVAAPLVICPHTTTKPGRSGQNICTDCGEDVTHLPKKSTFGFQ